MLFPTDMRSIFKQQVFSPFKDSFMLLNSFPVLVVTDLVDDTVKSDHNMKEIKDDCGVR